MKQALALTPSKPTPHTTVAYTCTLDPSTRDRSLAAPDTCMHTGARADPHTPHQHIGARRARELKPLSWEGGRSNLGLLSLGARPRAWGWGGKRQPWDVGARRAQEERLPSQTAPTLISWARERGVSARFVQGRRCLREKCDGRL